MNKEELKNFCTGLSEAAQVAQVLDDTFMRCAAVAVSAFWRDCFPVLSGMVHEIVPQSMALVDACRAHPELAQQTSDSLFKTALKVKQENPSGSYDENLRRVISRLGPAADG